MRNGQGIRRSTKRATEVRAAFADNYTLYQYCFVEFLIEHLSDLSRAFRGDLQKTLVLGLIGQVHIRAIHAAAEAGLDFDALPLERRSITASSIADVTGIPRETVRRKCAAMEQQGWILRSDEGAWRLVLTGSGAGSVVRAELSDLDQRGLDRVSRLFRDLEAIVAAAPAAAPAAEAATGAPAGGGPAAAPVVRRAR